MPCQCCHLDIITAFCLVLTFFGLFFLCLQMSDIVEVSQSSTRELQEQIDIYKEKNRRELTELQRLLKERELELEKHMVATKALQGEVKCIMAAFFNVMCIQGQDTNVNADSAFQATWWSDKGHH